MPSGGKALVDWVSADHYGENKEYNDCGVGWLLLSTLETLKKENDMLRILNLLAWGMIRRPRSSYEFLEESFISCSCRADTS